MLDVKLDLARYGTLGYHVSGHAPDGASSGPGRPATTKWWLSVRLILSCAAVMALEALCQDISSDIHSARNPVSGLPAACSRHSSARQLWCRLEAILSSFLLDSFSSSFLKFIQWLPQIMHLSLVHRLIHQRVY